LFNVVASNYDGALPHTYTSGPVRLIVTVTNSPIITNFPAITTNQAKGGLLFLTVGHADTCKPVYQWYFNTNNLLAGGTNASLMLTNLGLNNAGKYSVVVGNAFGSSTGAYATLVVDYVETNVVGTVVITNGQSLALTLIPETNRVYYLQYKTDLLAPTWQVLSTSRVTNTTGVTPIELKDRAATELLKFYRIVSEPLN
jgi:hypothetical protein